MPLFEYLELPLYVKAARADIEHSRKNRDQITSQVVISYFSLWSSFYPLRLLTE
jgi:hypothetical protein